MIIMTKLKNGFLVLLMAAALALLFTGMAQAVQFTYYVGGIYSEAGAYAVNESFYDGPRVSGRWDLQNSYSSTQSFVGEPYVSADGVGSGFGESLFGTDLNILMRGQAAGVSEGPGSGWAYGNANTVAPTYSNGLFFRLDPTVGEQVGDPVRVYFNWSFEASTSDGGSASITGGDADRMALTLNDVPTWNPDLSKTVWWHENVILGENTDSEDSADGEFMAKIGDIIGIHLGAMARVDFTGEGNFYADAENRMTLQAEYVPLPASLWLLGSGLLGLVGLRRFRKN
jgi:hypothetical protein